MPRSVLHIGQILAWADAHFERTGKWPERKSGRVWETADEKWQNIDMALRQGLRGLRPGSSLARLLSEHRGKRNRKRLPEYTAKQILKWADAHYERSGKWPTNSSGPIADAPGETWMAVDMALRHVQRGLPGGSSLPQLLAARRRVPNRLDCPRLSVGQILAWADSFKRRTGNWPTADSGTIPEAGQETWVAIDSALKKGSRGLRSRSSLFKVLARHRGVKRHVRKPPLSVAEILVWMEKYRARHGRWPKENSGPIAEPNGETWCRVSAAFRKGTRGLPSGLTFAQLRNRYGKEASRQPRLRAMIPLRVHLPT